VIIPSLYDMCLSILRDVIFLLMKILKYVVFVVFNLANHSMFCLSCLFHLSSIRMYELSWVNIYLCNLNDWGCHMISVSVLLFLLRNGMYVQPGNPLQLSSKLVMIVSFFYYHLYLCNSY